MLRYDVIIAFGGYFVSLKGDRCSEETDIPMLGLGQRRTTLGLGQRRTTQRKSIGRYVNREAVLHSVPRTRDAPFADKRDWSFASLTSADRQVHPTSAGSVNS